MKPPESKTDWLMLGAVALIAFIADMLKVISRGEPLTPAQELIRRLARAALTGIIAAGIWAGVTQKWVLNPTVGVAVAGGTAMLGVDFLERLLVLFIEKRTGTSGPEEKKP